MTTPMKRFKVLQLTPQTKKLVGVLCGNRTEVSDYRRKKGLSLYISVKWTVYLGLILKCRDLGKSIYELILSVYGK